MMPSQAISADAVSSLLLPLIDTHTHFDEGVFDYDRVLQIQLAQQSGVRHLLLIGYLRQYFERMWLVQAQINDQSNTRGEASVVLPSLQAHVALGLHPFYIDEHAEADLETMHQNLLAHTANRGLPKPIAIGEVGLDTYLPELKTPEQFDKQKRFFIAQLDMAVAHDLPVLLHIRKAHADCLKILKKHAYNAKALGGIAHSFSGGEQEAKAFVKLGFKLGVTGQITNPNAKKLRRAMVSAVAQYGLSCLVIETDCPDMTPIMCQHSHASVNKDEAKDRNVPANLPHVLSTLSEIFDVSRDKLARQLWQNSCEALGVDWSYPYNDMTFC